MILAAVAVLQMSSVLQAAVSEIMSEMEKAPSKRRNELKRKMRSIVGDDRLQAMGITIDEEDNKSKKSPAKPVEANGTAPSPGKVEDDKVSKSPGQVCTNFCFTFLLFGGQ